MRARPSRCQRHSSTCWIAAGESRVSNDDQKSAKEEGISRAESEQAMTAFVSFMQRLDQTHVPLTTLFLCRPYFSVSTFAQKWSICPSKSGQVADAGAARILFWYVLVHTLLHGTCRIVSQQSMHLRQHCSSFQNRHPCLPTMRLCQVQPSE